MAPQTIDFIEGADKKEANIAVKHFKLKKLRVRNQNKSLPLS